jgi:hypothetical protein
MFGRVLESCEWLVVTLESRGASKVNEIIES